MRKNTLLFATALLLMSSGLFAQDIAELAQKFQTRYGKLEKQIKDMTMVQEITMYTDKENIVSNATYYYKGDKFRLDTKINTGKETNMNMETTILFDGTDTWMIAPFLGKKKLSEKDQAKYQKDKSWQWWNDLSKNAQIIGTEKIGARNCYIIQYIPPKENKKEQIPFDKMWIDMDNLVQVKAEMIVEKGQKVIAMYSDFRKVPGNWEMPFKTEIFAEKDNKQITTVIVKSVEVNKGVNDTLFVAGKTGKKAGFKDMFKGMVPTGE
jgi:outer membrane lipoprotein-sorting protein